MTVAAGIGPFAQGGLDEALGLAVGLGRIRLGKEVPDAVLGAGLAEGRRLVAAAVVGHHALDGNAQSGVVGQGRLQKGDCRVLALIGLDFGIGDPGVIIDADMDAFSPGAADAIPAVAGDPMADLLDAPELLGVEVQQLAGMRPFVAHHRRWWGPRPMATQDAAQTGLGEARVITDLRVGQLLFPPTPGFLAPARGKPRGAACRPRRAVPQAGSALGLIPRDPFTDGLRAAAFSVCPSLSTSPTKSSRLHGVVRALLCMSFCVLLSWMFLFPTHLSQTSTRGTTS